MCYLKNKLNNLVSAEKRRLKIQIAKLRSNLSKEDAKRLSTLTEYLSNNIEADGNYKILLLSQNATDMANTQEVSDVMSYVEPRAEKVSKSSKDSFDNLFYNLRKGKY